MYGNGHFQGQTKYKYTFFELLLFCFNLNPMHSENAFRKMARDEEKLILGKLYICKVVDGLERLGKRRNMLLSLSQYFFL